MKTNIKKSGYNYFLYIYDICTTKQITLGLSCQVVVDCPENHYIDSDELMHSLRLSASRTTNLPIDNIVIAITNVIKL